MLFADRHELHWRLQAGSVFRGHLSPELTALLQAPRRRELLLHNVRQQVQLDGLHFLAVSEHATNWPLIIYPLHTQKHKIIKDVIINNNNGNLFVPWVPHCTANQ